MTQNDPSWGSRESAESDECSWCGADIAGVPVRSRRGEVFCSKAHRDASARAVKALEPTPTRPEPKG